MEKEYILEIENVTKSFTVENKKQDILDNINLKIESKSFVSIVGPSGCGKSTFLRLVSNLLSVDKGLIKTSKDTKMSFVFQNFALFPWLNVEENISFGLKMSNVLEEEIKERVNEQIKEVKLEGFEYKHPKELSGGMKQRVGLARALVMEPKILLLDEPFSALDTITAEELRNDLLNIWSKYNLTILMVSHLIEEAVELSDRVIVFSKGPGKIIADVNINLKRPREKRTKEFFSYVDELTNRFVKNE